MSVTSRAAMAREPMGTRADHYESKDRESQKYSKFLPGGHLLIEVQGALIVE